MKDLNYNFIMPVNLKVPADTSKKVDELISKANSRRRNELDRSSVSLRIPNRSLASLSDLTSTLMSVTTQDTPDKEQKIVVRTRRASRKKLKYVGLKSLHQATLKKSKN
jgi:hypothetical protein